MNERCADRRTRKELDIGRFLTKVNKDFERSGLPKIVQFSFFEEKPNVFVTVKDETGLMGFGFARYSYEDEKNHRDFSKAYNDLIGARPVPQIANTFRKLADELEYDPMRGIVLAAKRAIRKLRSQPIMQKGLDMKEGESVKLESVPLGFKVNGEAGDRFNPERASDQVVALSEFLENLFEFESARQAGEVPGVPPTAESKGRTRNLPFSSLR